MAIVKLVDEPYYNDNALNLMFHYLEDQDNLINDTSNLSNFMGGCNFLLYDNIDTDTVADQFQYVKNHFHKPDGKQLIHLIVSFPSNELNSMNKAKPFADFICNQFCNKYQILYAIHHKPNNLHIHFIFNTVSFVDGYYIYNTEGFSATIRNYINYYFGKNIARFA